MPVSSGRLRALRRISAPLVFVLLGSGASVNMTMAWRVAAESQRVTQVQLRLTSDLEQFRYYDEALTMSARVATSADDVRYAARYRMLVPKLTAVLEDAERLLADPDIRASVAATDEANDALVAIELAALDDVSAGRPAAGYALVTSARYEALKRRYHDGMESALTLMATRSQQRVIAVRKRQLTGLGFATAAMVGLLLTMAVSALGWRRSRREQLRDGARTSAILDSATVSFVELDAYGRVLACNRRAVQSSGWSAEEMHGMPLLDLLSPAGSPDRRRWSALIKKALGGAEAIAREIPITLRDGRAVPVEAVMWPSTDERGRVNVFVRDVTERAELVAQLRAQALTDPLTGLPNRRALTERLAEVTAAGGAARLLLVDLDEFKVLNDAYGHGVGDLLLQAMAVRISEAISAAMTTDAELSVLCARLGGDEFAVLLVGDDHGLAEDLAGQFVASLAGPFELEGGAVTVTASVGLATRVAGVDADLLADADLALYAAKAAGRRRWAQFDLALRETALQRATVERELRLGLARGEIVPHFQPVVRVHDGAILGVEALARWQHPERGLLPPGVFVDVAEQSDLVIELGVVMLDRACAQLAAWDRELGAAAPSYVAVNLSARHLGRQHLITDIAEVLRTHGLAPHRLVIEVTEAAIIEDAVVTTGNLRGLRELGIRLAVDDFGTGHSSLARLGALPVHILKIDRSFVSDMGANGAPIVELTLGLAEALGLDVIAEGVETAAQRDQLDQLGCANAQGFLYARPGTAEQVGRLCVERATVHSGR